MVGDIENGSRPTWNMTIKNVVEEGGVSPCLP